MSGKHKGSILLDIIINNDNIIITVIRLFYDYRSLYFMVIIDG